MKTSFKPIVLTALAAAIIAPAAHAADIRAAPTTLELAPGARTATLTVINEESRARKVQIRVMRWTQVDGQEVLAPTQDVVASPPFANLQAGQKYLVRVVRVTKAPPQGEESYRVLIDEVPDPNDVKPGAVNLILRQSIPAFFSDEPRRVSIVDWSMARQGSQLWLVAKNRGGRRLRLSDVAIQGGAGAPYQQAGLVGYVLPGTTMRFPIAADPALAGDKSLRLKAMSDTGPLEVSLVDGPGA
jgi:fimbrial chaperone protein